MNQKTSVPRAIQLHRALTRVVGIAILACGLDCSGDSSRGDMFSFLRGNKRNDSTTVAAVVGAPLAPASQLPAAPAADAGQAGLRLACRPAMLDGDPTGATLRTEGAPGQSRTAFIVTGAQVPLAVLTIGGASPHIEVWELQSNEKPTLTKQRVVRLDPQQPSWAGFVLTGVACLPGSRLLVAVIYHDPSVKEALFIYDVERDAYTKLAVVAPDPDDNEKLFEAQVVGPEAAMVRYNTGRTFAATEYFYNALNHVVLFDARHPDGLELLKLAAVDGTIDQWRVVDKKLWLQTTDKRKPGSTKHLIWSLDVGTILP